MRKKGNPPEWGVVTDEEVTGAYRLAEKIYGSMRGVQGYIDFLSAVENF